MDRRRFLSLAAAGWAAPQIAKPAPDGPAAGLRLGYDTYSIRALRWKALELLEYAARRKLDAIQLSSLNDFESLEPAYLKKVREAGERLGLQIDGGIGCICKTSKSWNPKEGDPETYLRKGLSVAKQVGASSMRCYLGAAADRVGAVPIEAHMEETIRAFRAVRSYAQDTGVKIALENHSGDMQAREVRTIIEEAGKDFVASCLDTGNPTKTIEDPMVTLEILGPYAVTTHVRDSAIYETPRGCAVQWVAMGDGVIDWPAFFRRYRELCPKASVQLEVITGRPPEEFAYLEFAFWKAYPKANAAEFARFVALAKRGKPYTGRMVVEDGGPALPEFQAALREQQRLDLERSLTYAQKVLGAGLRWKMA